jgi:hypothetical protein
MNKLNKITILFGILAVLFTANISYAANIPYCVDKECLNVYDSYNIDLANKIVTQLASTTLNVKLSSSTTTSTTTNAATDGENTISILLYILILLTIFSGVHNAFIGVKIKKQLYD